MYVIIILQTFKIKFQSRVIYASIFYLVSSLPSNNTNLPADEFYGISPTGLGRGETFDDYEGSNKFCWPSI